MSQRRRRLTRAGARRTARIVAVQQTRGYLATESRLLQPSRARVLLPEPTICSGNHKILLLR